MAEGRLKNALEGVMLGALAEPLSRSLRALKYARIKWTAFEVRTKVHYRLNIVYYEAHNSANYTKLLQQLENQNLSNMSWDEPTLAKVIKGNKGELNYGIGIASSDESNRLGKLWVGDGYIVDSNGGLLSADGTRGYRFPSNKNTRFSKTGIQSNFETYQFNELGKK